MRTSAPTSPCVDMMSASGMSPLRIHPQQGHPGRGHHVCTGMSLTGTSLVGTQIRELSFCTGRGGSLFVGGIIFWGGLRGAKNFSRDQKGGPKFVLEVKGGGGKFFSKMGANFFFFFFA